MLKSLPLIVVVLLGSDCVGGRVGLRYDYDLGRDVWVLGSQKGQPTRPSRSGVYAGPLLMAGIPRPKYSNMGFSPGLELSMNFATANHFFTFGPWTAVYSIKRPLGVGIMAVFEFGDVPAAQLALCGGGGYQLMTAMGCGRWSSNGWLGVDMGGYFNAAALLFPQIRLDSPISDL